MESLRSAGIPRESERFCQATSRRQRAVALGKRVRGWGHLSSEGRRLVERSARLLVDESSCPCPFLSDTKVVDELDGLFLERDGEDYDVGRNLKMEFLQLWDGVRDCLDDK